MVIRVKKPVSELLTSAQLMDYLQVSEYTLINWRRRGIGPAYVKLTNQNFRYHKSDVDAWLKANQVCTSFAKKEAI